MAFPNAGFFSLEDDWADNRPSLFGSWGSNKSKLFYNVKYCF